MNFIDMRTVIVGLVGIDFICAVMLGLLYWHNRRRYAGLALWTLALLMQAAAMTLLLTRGVLPDLISINISNMAGLAGILLLYAGFLRFWGKPSGNPAGWLAFAVFSAVHAHFTFHAPSLAARSVNLNFWMAVFFARCAWDAYAKAPADLRKAARGTAQVMAGFAAVAVTRLGLAVFGPPAHDFFSSGAFDTALVFLYQLLTVLLTMGLFLLVNRRILADTRADYEGRVEAERGLRESAGQLELALAAAGMGLWQLDIAEDRRYFDERVCALLGLNRKYFTGRPEEFFGALHPEDRPKVKEALARAVAGDAPYAPEYRVVWPDGSVHHISSRGRLIRDAKGRPWRLEGLLWDITEAKTAEAAMQYAQKLESLGALAGGIAHDFNNLLTGITSNLSLIGLKAGKEGETAEMVAEAEHACRAAKSLARQLLTFAAGGEPVCKPLDLGKLARESVDFSLRGSGVAAEYVLDKDVFVLGDKDQVFQVVQNLAMNAAQALAGSGTVKISVREAGADEIASERLPAGRYGAVTVRDSGPGMPPAVVSRLFEPYFSTKGKGRGLGLSVCRSIALKHGGGLSVGTEEGKGSSFTVYLPYTAERPEATDRRRAPAGSAKGRVLVMDDEEVVSKALRRILTHLGYEAEVAQNGEKALEAWRAAMAQQRPFLAVIMDLTISGGMGGAEAVLKLKSLDPSAKAIVSSGYADDPVMAAHEAHGFDGALPKPFKVEDIERVLSDAAGN